MNTSKLLLAGLAVAAAKTETYVIHYDEFAWNTMQLSMLPTNTKYILKELHMHVAELDEDEVREFEAFPGVTLYKDQEMHILDYHPHPNSVQDNPPSWGLDRIDQRDLPLDKKYHWEEDGKGVDVWIVDTGVHAAHSEFDGRAVFDHNFAKDGQDDDCNGHGTHVSSTIGGKNVGVAKGATIKGVKVLSCNGSGSMSNVLAGINHVVMEHVKIPSKKSVINMSLGGGKNQAVNLAVGAAVKAGITVVVAAGNENDDACNSSPASAPGAISVAASTVEDQKASFSNWGECCTLYAPGHNIYGAWIGGKDEYKTISGTSMASPHTAGVAALVLSRGDAIKPAEVKKYLVEHGTKDVIKGNVEETPNILLYSLKD